jgi:DNA-binding NarL/FixJ family response regulator
MLSSDEPIIRAGLASILAANPLFRMVSGPIAEVGADILLLDLTSDRSLYILREIRKIAPAVKIIVWTYSIETELALQVMAMGVRGILRKTLEPELLLKCLQSVYDGEFWYEKALTDSFLGSKRVALTRREAQLVSLLSQGLKNKQIATIMLISEGTVKVYLSRLFAKVGAKDRFTLALWGLKNLSVSPPSDELVGKLPADPMRAIFLANHTAYSPSLRAH